MAVCRQRRGRHRLPAKICIKYKRFTDKKTAYGFRFTTFGRFSFKEDLSVLLVSRDNFGIQLEFDPLLRQRPLELLRYLFVDPSTTNGAQELDHRNLRAKTTPNAAQFQANNTTSNDDHLLWNLLQLQSTGRADDLLLVNLNGASWEGSDL